MRIGCCIPGGSFMPQEKAGEMNAYTRLTRGSKLVLDSGFDFAESALGVLMELTEDELRAAAGHVALEACNCFIPGAGTVIEGGESLKAYVHEAMRRMRALGCGLVVFGSGRARNIPDAMPREEGMARIRDFLAMCQEAGEKYGVDVCIEPLNRRETNAVNLVSQAAELAREVGLSHIAVLADSYHMALENEPLDALSGLGSLLRHVHVSEADRRRPGITDSQRAVAQALRDAGYARRVSAECIYENFAAEAPLAARYMREVFT